MRTVRNLLIASAVCGGLAVVVLVVSVTVYVASPRKAPRLIAYVSGVPVHAKVVGKELHVSFSDKPMPCKPAHANCEYIPAVVDLAKLIELEESRK